jgi:hypothetical protein
MGRMTMKTTREDLKRLRDASEDVTDKTAMIRKAANDLNGHRVLSLADEIASYPEQSEDMKTVSIKAGKKWYCLRERLQNILNGAAEVREQTDALCHAAREALGIWEDIKHGRGSVTD